MLVLKLTIPHMHPEPTRITDPDERDKNIYLCGLSLQLTVN